MRSRRSGSGRPLGDTKESDRRVTCKAPLGPTWNEGQASPRRRPQPFSRILTAWKGNSRNSAYSIVHRTPPQHRKARSLAHPNSNHRPLHVVVLDRYTGS
jgi:hypothetical protein